MSVPAGSNNKSSSASTTIPLKVLEIYTNYGPGVVVIDETTMSSIGATLGDIVEILGKKKP